MNKPNAQSLFPKNPYADWIAGSCEPWTVDIISAIIRATNPRYMLETGTFEAKTTMRIHWASSENSTFVSLECDEKRWERASALCSEFKGVTILNVEAVSYLPNYKGPKFDFVFLDDDHDAEHVATELDLLYNFATGEGLTAPGGIICVHDVCGPFGLGAVVVARHGFLLDLPKLHAAGGLGLIQVPA